MPMRRRDVLIAAGAVGLAIAAPRAARLFKPPFDFEPIPGLPGFRRLTGGPLSAAGDVFLAGIDILPPERIERRNSIAAAPCAAAFGTAAEFGDALPVAVFTDYRCPYCPALSALILSEAENGTPIHPVWHDLPLLGPRSDAAARLAIAAGKQGQYVPAHRHLMQRAVPPSLAGAQAVAEALDLDAGRLAEDASGAETTTRIETTRDIAAVFGIIGTPATLIGRTLVIGRIERAEFRRLVTLERQAAVGSPMCF
ncbi:DsbA family protein [Arenibacterium sp. CAU 1754]